MLANSAAMVQRLVQRGIYGKERGSQKDQREQARQRCFRRVAKAQP
jgi:hypothetical protein